MSIDEAVVSVRAGFTDKELSALWPREGRWQLHEYRAGLFTHCFAACRSAPVRLSNCGPQS